MLLREREREGEKDSQCNNNNNICDSTLGTLGNFYYYYYFIGQNAANDKERNTYREKEREREKKLEKFW